MKKYAALMGLVFLIGCTKSNQKTTSTTPSQNNPPASVPPTHYEQQFVGSWFLLYSLRFTPPSTIPATVTYSDTSKCHLYLTSSPFLNYGTSQWNTSFQANGSLNGSISGSGWWTADSITRQSVPQLNIRVGNMNCTTAVNIIKVTSDTLKIIDYNQSDCINGGASINQEFVYIKR